MKRSVVREALESFDEFFQAGDSLTFEGPLAEAARRWVDPDIEAAARLLRKMGRGSVDSNHQIRSEADARLVKAIVAAALGYEEET